MNSVPELGGLMGCLVTRVSLDYQVGLLLAGGEVDATLTVECPLTVDGVRVSPDTGEGYEACVRLLRRSVTSVQVDDGGTLRIGFDGVELVATPDPRYNAWELDGRRGVPSWLVGPD